LSSVLRPRQHSIGYMGDGYYRSKYPTNSIKVLKVKLQRTNQRTKTTKYTYAYLENSWRCYLAMIANYDLVCCAAVRSAILSTALASCWSLEWVNTFKLAVGLYKHLHYTHV